MGEVLADNNIIIRKPMQTEELRLEALA